jgi:hypothetical protein
MRKNLTEEGTTISNPKNFDTAETLENHQPDYHEKIHQSLLNILKSVQEKKKNSLTEDRYRFLNTIELYCQEVLTNPSKFGDRFSACILLHHIDNIPGIEITIKNNGEIDIANIFGVGNLPEESLKAIKILFESSTELSYQEILSRLMNFEQRKKLPRIYNNRGYTTGDAQRWTYEYTWEDYEVARHILTPSPKLHKLMLEIFIYFVDYPEKLLKGGWFKWLGWSVEQIKRGLELEKKRHILELEYLNHRYPRLFK